VNPARTSAATTIATDALGARSLSIATAGLQAVFTITAKDLYRNLRGVGGESFKVRLTGVDSTAGVVTDRGDGMYVVSYTATKSGTYDISVVIGAGGISGSPFRLYVQPAARHMSNSIATGASLTLATAGIQAVLTLTVKDRFDNWQPSNSVVSTAQLKFFLSPNVQIDTIDPTCVNSQPPAGDCPNFVDTTTKLAATPTSLDKATVVLRYKVTTSGVYKLALRGLSKFDGPVNNSPFPLTVFPHLPCASTSTAVGTALTLVTAGMAGTFTIQSKDMNYNLRGSQVGDNFVSFVRQALFTSSPNIASSYDEYNHGSDFTAVSANTLEDHRATVIDMGDSTYVASFVATKSVTNTLWSMLGYRGSIIATYYSSSYGGSPPQTMGVKFSSVEFTCSNGQNNCPAAGLNDGPAFKVRFQGLFRPSRSGKLHFKMTMNHASQSMIFMMNNKLIVSATATGANHQTTSQNGFVVVSNQFYHIFISFAHPEGANSDRTFKLQYAYHPDTTYQTIESTALFLAVHSAGSPFLLNVRPTIACATLSTIRKMAVSLSTAGYPALFTMQTRDEFNNQGETSGDPYDYALMQGSTLPGGSGSQDDSKDGGTLMFQGTLSYSTGGGYNLRYTATLRGTFGLRGKILQSGGLFGTYFENDDLTDHGQLAWNPDIASTVASFQRIDPTIDFVWSTNQPVDPSSAEFQAYIEAGNQFKKRIGPDYFSVRWTGLIQPRYTEVFTFSAEVDDGIRLWIDDLLIVNFWSLKSAIVDGTIALMKDTMYSIKLEYRDVQGNATIRLFWRSSSQSNEIVPSSRLYHATTAAKLSQPQLFVQPSVICASQSSAVGSGLTVGTAGVMSYFTIQSRDEYGNNRVLGDAPYLTVRIVPISEARRPYHVNLNELNKPSSPVNSGITRIAGRGEYSGGLTATYYGDSSADFTNGYANARVSCMAQPWQDPVFCGGPKITGLTIAGIQTDAASSQFTARFKGNFLPTTTATYIFTLDRGISTSRAGLKVDGVSKVVLDNGNSADNNVYTAEVSMVTGNFYDLEVLYKSTQSGASGNFELKYSCCGVVNQAIPTSNLFPLAGRYNTYFTPSVKGDYSVSAAVALPGGLDATFYDDMSLSVPVANAIATKIDISTTDFRDTTEGLPRISDHIGFGNDLKLSDRNSFSARWQGFLKVVTSNVLTLTVTTHGVDERVRLWVDNVLLIDQWDSYQTITDTNFVATFSLAYHEETGVQLSDSHSYFDLRLEYKQFSNDASIKLSYEYGSGSIVIPSTALFLKRDISGSPFPPFAVVAAPTCSTTSTVRGSSLTSSTAGVASSFTIQSNDMYGNERGVGGDTYVVRLSAACNSACWCAVTSTCPVVLGSVTDLGDSSYVATYNATRRGRYMVHTSLAKPGSLTVSTLGARILSESTFTPPSSSTTYTFSGFVQPPTAGRYTFSTGSQSATHFSFIPQLNTATSSAPSYYEFSNANALYDISFQWSASSNAGTNLVFYWEYGGSSSTLVPTSRFFSRMDVNPSSGTCIEAGCPERYPVMTLQVENTDPAVSIASGHGLTLATAGWTASFTITAKDSFANERQLEEDSWSVLLVGPSKEAVLAANAMQDTHLGKYQVTYTVTQSGIFSVNILRGMAEGLKAEYFNNMWLLGTPAATVLDYATDYNWDSGVVKPMFGADDVVLGSDYMSVRWSGLFRIDPHQFSDTLTFSTETDEGVRFYLNNTLLIDGWDSVGMNFSATWPASGIDVVRNGMYSLKLEYRESTGPAFCRLYLSSSSFPKMPLSNFTSVLFSEGQHIFGSPFALYSFPAITCASASSAYGPGLSFGTTGNIASFVIQAKDEYSNLKTDWTSSSEVFVVRSQSPRSPTNTDASKIGTVTHNVVNGRYNSLYTATRTGTTNVYVSMVDLRSVGGNNIGVGLLATYYYARSNSEPLAPVFIGGLQSNNIISQYGKGTSTLVRYYEGVPNPSSGSVYTARVAGLFKPTSSGVYTFQLANCAPAPRVESAALFVSNLQLVSQIGPGAKGSRSGTVFFPSSLRYYDITIEFQFSPVSGNPSSVEDDFSSQFCNLQFDFNSQGLNDLGNNVFRELAVANSPYKFVEAPDVTFWDRSIISAESLTIATAGVTSQFNIQSRDKNNNNRVSGGDLYIIQGASATGAAFSGTVSDNMDGSYTVVYTPSVQGAYILKHFLGEADKTTSLTVQPGPTCSSTSTSNSNYLTIATAGFQAWFTIQAKDQYKNLRTIGDNNFVLRLNGPMNEEHNLKSRYVGRNLVHQLGKFSTQYRTSRSGTFAINVLLASTQGLNATYYRDPNTESQVFSRIDNNVYFNWGSSTPDPQVGVTDSFSVSWTGFVKAPAFGLYTFAIATDGIDERIQLWVDNRYIINSWAATHATLVEATIMLNEDVLYDIKIRYNDLSGKSSVDLRWKYSSGISVTIPSNNLFASSHHILGSPFSATVFPAFTCGSSSTVTGDGLTLATAGIPASFTITAKDHLGNLCTTSNDIFVVRARPLTKYNIQHEARPYSIRNILGTVTPLGNGQYAAVYTPTKKAHALSHSSVVPSLGFGSDQPRPWHDVLVSLAKPGGLHATFYTADDFQGASVYDLLANNDISPPSSQKSFRFNGFFRPSVSTMYTFILSSPGASNNAKLHIDGKQVFDSTSVFEGTMQFFSVNALYDIYIEGAGSANIPDMSLKYKCCSQANYEYIPSGRLFQSQDVTHKTHEFNGLFATYYHHGGVPLGCGGQYWTKSSDVCVSHLFDDVVDWSGASITDRPHPNVVPTGSFSARWEGFIRPTRRDCYTFYVQTKTQTSGTVHLIVDDIEIIPETAQGQVLSDGTTYEFKGTVQFPLENDVYPIVLRYGQASVSNRKVALLWENTGSTYSQYGVVVPSSDWVNKSIVPSGHLSKSRSRPTVLRDDYTSDGAWWRFPESPCLGSYLSVRNELEYRECRGIGVSSNDILHVDVQPNVACASTSLIVRPTTVFGAHFGFTDFTAGLHIHMVTLTTAGSVRSFDIVIRDEYFNVRNGRDEAIMARQYLSSEYGSQMSSTNLFHGTVTFQPFSNNFNPLVLDLQHDPEGHYTATYLVTVAGDFQQEVSLAGSSGNGIAVSYFIGANITGGSVSRVESALDFNWGNSTPTTDTSIWGSLWSARCTGYIKVPTSEIITFTAVHEGSVRLWINSRQIVDAWSAVGTISSGTVLLSGNVLYDIRLEFSKTTSNAQVQLRYSSNSVPSTVVPSSALYPYKRIIGNGLLPLTVHHSIICASTSVVNGPGLTIATTGISASFTIQSRDEYQNPRMSQSASSCTGFFCQDCPSQSNCRLSSTLILDSPANKAYSKRQRIATIVPHASINSFFAMSYTYTKAGTHTVQTSYMKPGGLMATYYDDSAFAHPRRAVQETLLKTSWVKQSLLNDNLFSVRWAGSVQAQGGASEFVVNALAGDRYRLYVDEALVIDKWATAATGSAATMSGTINLNSALTNDFYNILLEYVSNSGNTNNVMDLRLGGASITTNNLYSRHTISGATKRLRINPNIACSVTSTHRGTGLTLATAGLQAVFTITSIDAYGNQRGIGGDTFVVRAFPLGLSSLGQPSGVILPDLGNQAGSYTFDSCRDCCLDCPPIVRASVVDRKDNTYLVSYTPTKRGDYKMISSLARVGGLTSTAYGSVYNPSNRKQFGSPAVTLLEKSVVDFSTAANDNLPSLSVATGTWRWQGFVQPSKAAQYTFYVGVKDSSETCQVWIDNNLVMTYSGSGAEISATFGFGLANSLYDIDVIYVASSGSVPRGITLKWESLGSFNAAENVVKGVVPSAALWSRHDVENMDIPNGDPSAAKNWMFATSSDSVERKLFVRPAIGCASMSTAAGNALTLATAGLQATFTIFAKDMWQNPRSIQNDMVWVATAFGSGGVPTVLAAVANIKSNTITGISSSDTLTTSAQHGLAVGDSVRFSVTNFVTNKLPTELSPNKLYYVHSVVDPSSFKISNMDNINVIINPVTSDTSFDLETNAYRVSYTINAAKQFSFFAKSSNFNAMNSPFSLTVVPHRQCGSQSTVFGSGISAAMLNSVTAFTIVARDFYGNRRTKSNDHTAADDVYLASVVYSSVPSPAPWSYNSANSVNGFSLHPSSGYVTSGTVATTYIVQATTIAGTGSGAVFQVQIASGGGVYAPTLLVGGYGYETSTPSVLKLFKTSYGNPALGDITISVTGVISTPGLDAVMVSQPSGTSYAQDGAYTGAYTLTTMPPGAAYAGAFFRAFLAVKGGLMATFYKAATAPNPIDVSLDSPSYTPAATLIASHISSAFTCSPDCYSGARFHGFYKASGNCPNIVVRSGTSRTYVRGIQKANSWQTASGSDTTIDGTNLGCSNGEYVELFHESRSGNSGSHGIASLLLVDTNSLSTANLYAAYAVSNTPVPLTVTN